ncbi:Isoleucine--tRNA ligase, mitochondrial [Oopsacas minuta]|uniref:isoleucine--tRNA ligase n=1 Tax=Oopsacas minuta TaxID=111878 RepID=A0AAV7KDV8_9METZ|nr:Isoleucine--tRNA ligase, mitochondrial [Oopsacas minuta]
MEYLEQEVFKTELEVVNNIEGSFLQECSYIHPIFPQRTCPLLPATHVTSDSGTGLVHTAPAHGPEDYDVAQKYNLQIECGVDDDGKYTDLFGKELKGKEVLKQGNSEVLSLLESNQKLFKSHEYTHRVPHDWRTGGPVILRATPQWFANVSGLVEQAKKALKTVKMIPRQSINNLLGHLEGRKDWCISRQRSWGVPIPVFYSSDDKPLITKESIHQIKYLIRREGTDAWWKLSMDSFLTPAVLNSFGKVSAVECIRKDDTLDVWFDSGTSWATILNEVDGVADVYIEGNDQHRGWFQSSLLTSVASQGIAPFKTVITHGFVLDEKNQKMSKSIGNVVNPKDVIDGNKKKKFTAHGADVARLWAAGSDFYKDISIGPNIMKQFQENFRKIRNTLRYMSSNLHDFSFREDRVKYSHMLDVDKFILHILHSYIQQVDDAYNSYAFSSVVKQLNTMCATDLSAFYFSISKDRLYCYREFSKERRACQTILYYCFHQILKSLAPILPHLAEEMVEHHQPKEMESIFYTREWIKSELIWENNEVCDRWQVILDLREAINHCIANLDNIHKINQPIDAYISLTLPKGEIYNVFKFLQGDLVSNNSQLNDAITASQTSIIRRDPEVIHSRDLQTTDSLGHSNIFLTHPAYTEEVPVRIDVLKPTNVKCLRCWKHISMDETTSICLRCFQIIWDYNERRNIVIDQDKQTPERRY